MMLPLAPQGIFRTIQGEGLMMGVPMVFIRLAGCDVNCEGCDTDYSVASRMSIEDISRRCVELSGNAEWIWITGGEPLIHDLSSLVSRLHGWGFRIALATSGKRRASGFDFISVSPHVIDDTWILRSEQQLNIVPGLNGLALRDLEGIDVSGFGAKFVTPNSRLPDSLAECIEWVNSNPGWRLGCQAHLSWRLP